MFWPHVASEMPNAAAETALCAILRASEAVGQRARRQGFEYFE
jgi:hypothetical protein